VITSLHLHTPLNRWPISFLPGRLLIFYGAVAGPLTASTDEDSAHQSPQLVTRHWFLKIWMKDTVQLLRPACGW
jgi:hypothetical protein